MAANMRNVRGKYGLLAIKTHDISVHQIRQWREGELAAGRPSSLEDFYREHGLCPNCRGEGVKMIGWSKPTDLDEALAAEDLGVEDLPLYDRCSRCDGSGSI